MSQKGISFRLNSQITIIAILIISAIVFINYHFSNKVLVQKIEEGAVNQSNLVISRIARITVGTEEIARNISYQALYYNQHNDVDNFINQVLKVNPLIEGIQINIFDSKDNRLHIFSTRKDSMSEMQTSDSLRLQNFLAELKSGQIGKGQGRWTDSYFRGYDSTKLLVSYQVPIYLPQSVTLAGVVSCDISLNLLGKILSQIKIGNQGYAFIIDHAGNFITHPNTQWMLSRNIYAHSFKIFKEHEAELLAKMKQGESGVVEGISEYLSNEESWYYFSPLTNTGWYAVIVIPEKELFGDINSIFHKIVYVSITGLFLLFLVNFFVFRRMLDPLVRVTYAIKSFTSPGKYKESDDEIKMLAESLEEWRDKYGLLMKDKRETTSEKLKIEKDLKTAQEIQQNIVPSGNPDFLEYPEIDLYAVLNPAEIIGGDLYDYFFIGKNHLLIAIGDVSGKGIPASLFMAIASTLIKTNSKILSAKDIVRKVNKELCERNSNQYFVTLFLGILDVRYGILDYCNAAHNFPYILHADGNLETLSKSHGLPLGIYSDKIYKNSTVELHSGDSLILYTDGVINSTDINNQLYGTEKLEINIKNLTNRNAEDIVNTLLKSVRLFEGNTKQADDLTLLALKYTKK